MSDSVNVYVCELDALIAKSPAGGGFAKATQGAKGRPDRRGCMLQIKKGWKEHR